MKKSCARMLGAGLACLVWGPSLFAAEIDPHLVNIAQSIKSQNYGAGLQNADAQLAHDPKNSTLLRLKGTCLLKEGKVNDAVVVLRQAVALDAESTAARYYLAQALAEQGSILESVQLLEQVVKEAPGSDYAQLANVVLPQLRSLAQTSDELPPDAGTLPVPRRFSVNLRLAGEYDDNVPFRANSEVGPGEKQSFAVATSEYVEVRPLDQKIDAAPLTLGVGYVGYQSVYGRSSLSDYDLIQHTGLIYLQKDGKIDGMPVQGRAAGSYEYNELGGSFYSRNFDGAASFSIQLVDWTATTLRYLASNQRYENPVALPQLYSRNGLVQQVGFSQYFYLLNNKLIMGAGFAYRWDDAEGSFFRENSEIVSSSMQAALPGKYTLRALGQYESAGYFNYTTSPERLDNIYTETVAVSHPLFTDDLNVEMAYTHTTSGSSIGFAQYHANIISFSLNYNY